MSKSWRCRFGIHTFDRKHVLHPDSPSAFYLECRRCGKFTDLPARPSGLG